MKARKFIKLTREIMIQKFIYTSLKSNPRATTRYIVGESGMEPRNCTLLHWRLGRGKALKNPILHVLLHAAREGEGSGGFEIVSGQRIGFERRISSF